MQAKDVLERLFCMANSDQLARLQALQNKGVRNTTRVSFERLVCVAMGVKPVQHFPKLKDSEGKNIKDSDGNDRRSDKPDGWQYTLSEFGTGSVVKVILAKDYSMKPLSVFVVSGLGYDMRQANMKYLDKNTSIASY